MPRKLEVQIVGDSASLERALGRAGKATDDAGRKFAGLGSMSKVAGVAIGVTLVAGLKSSISAAVDAQAAQARLQDALAKSGVSYKLHGAAIDDAIQKTSRLAALDDEDLSDAFSKLVRSTGSVTKATEGMNLAADIARARHISLEAATKTVEKGLLGSETAWKKVGVEITKGTSATDAFDKAQRQFAGSAESYGNTAAGAQDKFKVALENLQESIGSKVLPALAGLMQGLVKVIDWVEAHWPQISAVFDESMSKIKQVWETNGKPIFDAVVTVVQGVVTVVEALWRQFGGAIKSVIQTDLKVVEDVFRGLFMEIKGVFNLIDDLIHGRWSQLWGDAKQIVSGAMTAILAVIRGTIDNLFTAAKALGGAFIQGISAGLEALGGVLLRLIKLPINAVIDAWNSIGIPSFHVHIPVPLAPDIDFSTPSIGLPNIPHLDTGGYILQSGVAMVHKGETVLPAGRGGDLHVHIGTVIGTTLDKAANEILFHLREKARFGGYA